MERAGSRCVGLTALLSSRGNCLEIWEPQLTGIDESVTGSNKNCFTFYLS